MKEIKLTKKQIKIIEEDSITILGFRHLLSDMAYQRGKMMDSFWEKIKEMFPKHKFQELNYDHREHILKIKE